VRRRAERVVFNLERVRELRNELFNLQPDAVANEDSDSSGNVESPVESDSGSVDNSQNDESDNVAGGNAQADGQEEMDNGGDLGGESDDDNVVVADGDNNGEPNEVEIADAENNGGDADDPNRNLNEAEKEEYLVESLRSWACSGGVLSRRKIDEILIKLSVVFKTVPKSYKTLLRTAKNLDIADFGDSKFWYKSIKANLREMNLTRYLEVKGFIKIDINIDGLPPSRNKNHYDVIVTSLSGHG